MHVTEDWIQIFTDGACKNNPGPGGWGAVLKYKQHEKHLSGYTELTTNNRMELTAVIMALRSIKQPAAKIVVTTDSKYVQQGISQWLSNWKRNNWRTAAKDPVKNQDLWMELDSLACQHQIQWCWVKGHNNHPENELADQLATSAIKVIK